MSSETFPDLGSSIPPITNEILQELIKRKNREHKWKKRESLAGILLMISAGAFCIFIFFLQIDKLNTLDGFHRLLNNPINWLFAAGVTLTAISFVHAHNQAEEAENDYDQLREEMIDRNGELWPREPGGSTRFRVLHYLLKEKGINLFYK
ncbi:DUF2663 family protein [Sporolactobacillus sp. Y61]|uniref:DUF2663 family protein n=1 Tax=Sporolactobacillus sp. Y61 TaxID=3160863 RepID=A0AAU8IE97_9BACL